MERDHFPPLDPQLRANRIHAFAEELVALENELGSLLSDADRRRIADRHAELLGLLRARHDVDTTPAAHRLSLGMRVASLLGAVALAVAVYLFFDRYWEVIPRGAQAALLTVAPLLGVGGTELVARRERRRGPGRYFTGIAAAVACAALVTSVTVLSAIFNLPISQLSFLGWGWFALVLALGYDLPLLLVAGQAGVTVGILGAATALTGVWWVGFASRADAIAGAGVLWILAAVPLGGPERPRFGEYTWVFGASLVYLGLLALGLNGGLTALPFRPALVEGVSDVLGLAAVAGGFWVAIRRGWNVLYGASLIAGMLMLILKAFDWWWDVLPRYLLFLLVGAIAVGVVFVLRRLRARMAGGPVR